MKSIEELKQRKFLGIKETAAVTGMPERTVERHVHGEYGNMFARKTCEPKGHWRIDWEKYVTLFARGQFS